MNLIKMLAPFVKKQPEVENLIFRSFLDNESKNLYKNHYKERLGMLNLV